MGSPSLASLKPALTTTGAGRDPADTRSFVPTPAPTAAATTPATAMAAGATAALSRPGGNNASCANHDSGPMTRRSRPSEMLRNARTTVGSNCVPAQRAISAPAATGGSRLLVRPDRRHDVEDVGHRDDPAGERDLARLGARADIRGRPSARGDPRPRHTLPSQSASGAASPAPRPGGARISYSSGVSAPGLLRISWGTSSLPTSWISAAQCSLSISSAADGAPRRSSASTREPARSDPG